MQFAFMSYSFADHSLPALFDEALRLGYQGLEPRVASRHGHGLEPDCDSATRRQARQEVERTGVQLCSIATSCRFADPASSGQSAADARKAIDLAADVGCPVIRVFGGAMGPGLSRGQAIDHAASHLGELASQAEKRGVTITVETHDDWCDPADMARLLRTIDHPHVAVTWDLMHPVFTAGKTIDESFTTLEPWIRHVHVHDCRKENDQRILCPIGQGIIDHRRALALLRQMGYAGFVSGEWIRWQPGEQHLPRELATLESMLHQTA